MNTKPEDKGGMTLRVASALFEIETGDPSKKSRTVLWVVCALFAVLLLWAFFAKLDIVAVAQGRLVPQTYVKIVQPAEAGIIREILVKDGDSVQRGDVLVRLDPTVNAADSVAVSRELALERLQLRRIEAELGARPMTRRSGDNEELFLQVEAQGLSHRQSFLDSIAQETAARERARRELDAAREVRKKLENTLPSYEKSAAAYEKLANEKLIGTLQAEERRREASEKAQDLQAQLSTVASLDATINEREQRLAQLRSAYLSDLNQQRLQTVGAINRLEQQQGKLTYQEGLLELRAPQAGIVKELATTTLGAVVQPGTVILSLVPANEPLRAEVLVENKDIGFVRKGQFVRVKLAAFQFQKYGMLEGIVQTVSADSTSNKNESARSGESEPMDMSFKALIELRQQQLNTNGLILPLAVGMQVSAEIIQGKRTVLEYLLSPVQRITSEAAMER
jgi:hemolysin D